jgi:hypothetical protein
LSSIKNNGATGNKNRLHIPNTTPTKNQAKKNRKKVDRKK